MVNIITTPQVNWIVTLIVIDVVLGIMAALMKKDFRLGKVANFLWKPVLAYVFGFMVLVNVAQDMLVQAAFILIVLALIGSILHNLGKMGLSIPAYLKKE